MTKDIIQSDRSIFRRYRDMLDGTHAEVVVTAQDGASHQLLVTRYTAVLEFQGVRQGDVVRRTDVIEIGAVTTVVSVHWLNETTNLPISAPENIGASLVQAGNASALTQAQLMSAGLATSANQITALGYLADLADGNDNYQSYKIANSDDQGQGVKYILKTDGLDWLMIRKAYTATSNQYTFASQLTNSGIGLNLAWDVRTELTYTPLGQV